MKPPLAFRKLAAASFALAVCSVAAAAAEAVAALDESRLPPPATRQVEFERDIRPLFEERCYRCHGPERPKSGFRLDNRATALKGGDLGVDIIPGQSGKSPLIHYVARVVEDMEMPPPGRGEPLTSEQVGLLRAWIDQGALYSEESTRTKLLFSIQPSFTWLHVSGNEQQFREQTGLREGWSGGLQDFHLEERTPDGLRLETDGRALINQDDYRLRLNLEKPNLGFLRLGFEQFRRYYDDTGGYYEPFGSEPLSLDKDLHLDMGRAWFDVGLTLPKWPRIVLGYEHQYREGAKSSLAWSDVAPAPGEESVAIYPSYEDLRESAHILKVDVSHELAGVFLEDNFRAEFYDLNSRRVEYAPSTLGTPPELLVLNKESYDHFQAVNTFRLEKKVKDWLLLGGGYLYSKLDGDGGFSRVLMDTATFTPIAPVADMSTPIVLERESHLYNLSSLWGPWSGLSLTAGLQNEWTHEEGFGNGLLRILDPTEPAVQHLYSSQRDRVVLQEDIGLRYTRIPFTVLFAEARLRQEWIDHFERDEGSLESMDFLRDTDDTVDYKDIRTGFTVSPWKRVSFQANYRHRIDETHYDHDRDEPIGAGIPFPGFNAPNGYPAFIRHRNIESDMIEARLVLHPATWIKTTLKYQLVASDFRTETDSSIVLGPGTPVPPGSVLAGDHDQHIYSLNATITPWRRLNLSTTFSYHDTLTVSGVNGVAGVTPYGGDIYNVLSSANFIINNTTDCNLSYTFSRADFRQERSAETLPLGIDYDRHGLIAGLTRRFGKRMIAHLQYGFFRYSEPSAGHARDYTAHGVFASWKVVFE